MTSGLHSLSGSYAEDMGGMPIKLVALKKLKGTSALITNQNVTTGSNTALNVTGRNNTDEGQAPRLR